MTVLRARCCIAGGGPAVQSNVIGRVLSSGASPGIAWPIRLMQKFPVLRRIPARLIGMGFRPEHVRT